jgi:hypothetical protein
MFHHRDRNQAGVSIVRPREINLAEGAERFQTWTFPAEQILDVDSAMRGPAAERRYRS